MAKAREELHQQAESAQTHGQNRGGEASVHQFEPKTEPKEDKPFYKTPAGKIGAGILAAATLAGGAFALRSNPQGADSKPAVNAIDAQPIQETPPLDTTELYTKGAVGLDYPQPVPDYYVSVENDTSELVHPIEDTDAQTQLNLLLSNAENLRNSDNLAQAATFLEHLIWAPEGQAPSGELADAKLQLAAEWGTTYHFDYEGEVIPEDTDMSSETEKVITFMLTTSSNGTVDYKEVRQLTLRPKAVYLENEEGVKKTIEWLIYEEKILSTLSGANT